MRYDSRVSDRSNQVKVVLYLGREAWIKAKWVWSLGLVLVFNGCGCGGLSY